MTTLIQRMNEAEQYFNQLEQNKSAIDAEYQYICSSISSALSIQNYNTLLNLIPYIESGKGHLAFEHIGEVRRFLRILNIIALEQKYLNFTFASTCSNLEELMNKYYLTLFAFRRLIFQLSEDSVNEAAYFLKNNIISPFAAYIILSDELIIPNQTLYNQIASLYIDIWSHENMQQFLSLTKSS